MDGTFSPPTPTNEPVRGYASGSPERASLVVALEKMESEVIDLGELEKTPADEASIFSFFGL